MPAIPADPVWLWGRDLRAAVVVLLRRQGEMSLREIQIDLRRRGFAIAGDVPHKTLADALRYEVRIGRVSRPHRGHYAPAGGAGARRPVRRRRRVCELPGYGEVPARTWRHRRRWWREDVQLLCRMTELGLPALAEAEPPPVLELEVTLEPALRRSPWWQARKVMDGW